MTRKVSTVVKSHVSTNCIHYYILLPKVKFENVNLKYIYNIKLALVENNVFKKNLIQCSFDQKENSKSNLFINKNSSEMGGSKTFRPLPAITCCKYFCLAITFLCSHY